MLYGVLGAFENLLHWQFCQCVQPQLLDLLELGLVGVGGVILVMVIQPKQGEDLVNGLDVTFIRGLPCVSWPSWCR